MAAAACLWAKYVDSTGADRNLCRLVIPIARRMNMSRAPSYDAPRRATKARTSHHGSHPPSSHTRRQRWSAGWRSVGCGAARHGGHLGRGNRCCCGRKCGERTPPDRTTERPPPERCRCHQRVQPRMRHRTGACGLAYMRRAEGWEEREIVRAFAAGGRCPCAHVSARLCERMRHGSRARERRMACGEHDANAVARYARQRCWRLGGWGHTCPRPPSPRTRLFH